MSLILLMHEKGYINLFLLLDFTGNGPSIQGVNVLKSMSINEFQERVGQAIFKRLKNQQGLSNEAYNTFGTASSTISKIQHRKTRSGNMSFKTCLSLFFTFKIDILSIFSTDWKSVDIKPKNKRAAYKYPENALRMILSTMPYLWKQFYDGKIQILSFEEYLAISDDEHGLMDVHAVDSNRQINIFMEIQIGTMDSGHFEQVEKIIRNKDNCIIIWVASKANRKFFDDLQMLIQNLNKNISLLFVEFDSTLIQQLDCLAAMSPYHAFETIMKTNYEDSKFKLIAGESSPPESLKGSYKEPVFNNVQSIRYNQLISELKEQLPYYSSIMSCHYPEGQKYIRISAGYKEIELRIYLGISEGEETFFIIRTKDKPQVKADFNKFKVILHKIKTDAGITEVDERNLKFNYGKNNFKSSDNILVKDIGMVLSIFSE